MPPDLLTGVVQSGNGILTAERSMKKLTIRLPDDLNDQLAELARASHRSTNRQVLFLIEAAVKAHIAHKIAQKSGSGSPEGTQLPD